MCLSCEFGACGVSSFAPGCPTCEDHNPGFSVLDTILALPGGLLRLAFTGHVDPPSAECTQNASNFANKIYPSTNATTVTRAKSGFFGSIVGYAFGSGSISYATLGAGGGVYVDYAYDKALKDAAYSSALRDCMKGH
jgi:hypothetical protein